MNYVLKIFLTSIVVFVSIAQENRQRPKIGTPTGAQDICLAEYKNGVDAIRCITSAYSKAFPSGSNIFITGFSSGVEASFNDNLFPKLERYIQGVIDRPLSFGQIGTSEENKKLFNRAIDTIRDIHNNMINTIKALRNSNYLFAKDRYADVNLDKVKEEISKLTARVNELVSLQKELQPKKVLGVVTDTKPTLEIKDVLVKTIITLEEIIKKGVAGALDELRPAIRFAIDNKRYGGSQGKDLKNSTTAGA